MCGAGASESRCHEADQDGFGVPASPARNDERPHRIQASGHAVPRLCVNPQQFVQVTSGVMVLVGGSQPALSRCAGAGAVTTLLSIGPTIGSGAGAFAATICSSRLAGATRLFSSPSTPL